MRSKSLAISAALILMMVSFLPSASSRSFAFVTIDPVPSVVAVGDEVVFTGKLTDIEGRSLEGRIINISEEKPTTFNVVTTATTDSEGNFAATWIADLENPATDRIMSISATFAGDEQYPPAKSGRVGMRVAVLAMVVSILSDKPIYFGGDRATVTIKFASPDGTPIDPESLTAFYDAILVTVERMDAGHYLFKTSPLTPPTHSFQLVAQKHGYKIFRDAITIDVLAPQILPVVRASLTWVPDPILQGRPVNFTLLFTDSSNIITPFVNYNFQLCLHTFDAVNITGGCELAFELRDQQTKDGTASHVYTFDDGGKYTGTVRVTSLGEKSELQIGQVSNFSIDVIKSSAFAVKVKALKKGEGLRVTFLNPELSARPIYGVSLHFSDPNISMRTPGGWSVKTDGNTISIDTIDNPLQPGKKLFLRAGVKTTASLSFEWNAMDLDGRIVNSGSARVIALR